MNTKSLNKLVAVATAIVISTSFARAELNRFEVKSENTSNNGFKVYLLEAPSSSLIAGVIFIPNTFGSILGAYINILNSDKKKVGSIELALQSQTLLKGYSTYQFNLDPDLLKNSFIQISTPKDKGNQTEAMIGLGSFHIKSLAEQGAAANP